MVVKESRKNDLMQKREPRSCSIHPPMKVVQVWAVTLIVRASNTEAAWQRPQQGPLWNQPT